MNGKWLEIRDCGTFIPVYAFEVSRLHHRLAGRAGFGDHRYVCVYWPARNQCSYDPYGWTGAARTMTSAHEYIEQNWESLKAGDIIDVEFIEGETDTPKTVPDGLEML